jgi:hypothetical protein
MVEVVVEPDHLQPLGDQVAQVAKAQSSLLMFPLAQPLQAICSLCLIKG